ncbi:kinetochore Sim4 complex subunit Fta4 [Nemania sp. FL0916]|nr:kinetochore Sim4 complex subunit Fta4 [Nemania sp. FL0916]
MPPPTLIAHKSDFLAKQTLQLSQGLQPSQAWRNANTRAAAAGEGDNGKSGGLSTRAVDDAVYRLNHALTQHARRVYAPQATRHVAEQIEGLFYAEAERALRGDDEGDEGGGGEGELGGERRGLREGADFATDEAIASLPPTWDVQKPREATDHPLEAQRYAQLAGTLTTLSTRRQELRERVQRLRRMAAVLAPFETTQHQDDDTTTLTAGGMNTSVQDNLITRNGEVERELERMRLLLARVAGRVAQLPDKNKSSDQDGGVAAEAMDLDAVQRDKVDRLLELL